MLSFASCSSEPINKKIVGEWSREYTRSNYAGRLAGTTYTRIITFYPDGTVRDNYNEIIDHRITMWKKQKAKVPKHMKSFFSTLIKIIKE